MKNTKNRKRRSREDKDVVNAIIFFAAFLGALFYFAFADSAVGVLVTIGIFLIVLQASYKVEEAEKRAKRRINNMAEICNEILRNSEH